MNDLLQGPNTSSKNAAKRGPYRNVESKVKNYIAALPPPNSRRKPFRKHTSMPDYRVSGSEASLTSCLQLEHEYSEYRRQSEHTISELEKQVQVAVAMITQATDDNFDLMDQITSMQQRGRKDNQPTPEPHSQSSIARVACTPRKAVPTGPSRSESDDTTGSFIGLALPRDDAASLVTVALAARSITPHSPTAAQGKRNLSFNSSGEVTRRSGGTDSGIHTSAGNEIQIQGGAQLLLDDLQESAEPPPGSRVRRCIARWMCCGADGKAEEAPKRAQISYKKM